jgi:hypothetical protein
MQFNPKAASEHVVQISIGMSKGVQVLDFPEQGLSWARM